MHSSSFISKAAQSSFRNLSTASPAAARVSPVSRPAKANNPDKHFLYFIHEPQPKPINCTTYPATRSILSDPSHPLHIRTQRRIAAFDPHALHWNVIVPLDVSKKAVVRNWVRRRVGEAFKKILREQGEGRRVQGAVSMRVRPEMAAVAMTATGEDVEREVERVVGAIVSRGRSDWRRGDGSSVKRLTDVRSKGRQTSEWLLEKIEEV